MLILADWAKKPRLDAFGEPFDIGLWVDMRLLHAWPMSRLQVMVMVRSSAPSGHASGVGATQ